MAHLTKQESLLRRKRRTRATVRGTALRPRLTVSRSLAHISAQVINDETGQTLVAASDIGMKKPKEGGKTALAKAVGSALAEKAKAKGVTLVVFDRGGRAYHGRLKALAEGAREGGLEF